MRILHTSDWHLGRSFGDHSLLGDQAAFIDWFVDLAREEQADVVVIAGDLHDRSAPPVEAVSLLSAALRRLRETGARVVAIAGNHDSGARIAAFDGLVDAGGLLMRGGYGAASRVTVLDTTGGPLAVVATPFLDPLLVPGAVREELRSAQAEPDADAGTSRRKRLSHERVLAWALTQARACLPTAVPSLVVSHAFVSGGEPSESERELSIGTAGEVPACVYDGFDYVALGHLHRPQRVAATDRIRYSGSPLAYSFSEEHGKEVVLVELSDDGGVQTRSIPIDVGRRVITRRGLFEELVRGEPVADAWVRIELTDSAPVIDAHRQLRERFPMLVEIARIRDPDAGTQPGRLDVEALAERAPVDLATTFWEDMTGEPPSAAESALLGETLERVARETEA